MSKTIKEWFEQSKELWANEALMWSDTEKQDMPVGDLAEALLMAFDWDQTYQGDDFWIAIHKGLDIEEQYKEESPAHDEVEWIPMCVKQPETKQSVITWTGKISDFPTIGYFMDDRGYYARFTKFSGSCISIDSRQYPIFWYPIPTVNLNPPVSEIDE